MFIKNLHLKIKLDYHVDYFAFSYGIKGSMVDSQIELNYMYTDDIGLSKKFENLTFSLSHEVTGILGSVNFKY